ncbi:MAG: hypothetical protein ACYC4S_09645 [Rhodoferax sp.]
MNKNLSDAEVDRAAKSYALAHQVSYSEALDCVTTTMRAQEGAYSESVRLSYVSTNDAKIDAAAKAYARTHHVSYSDALDCVLFDSMAAFSEAPAAAIATAAAVKSLSGQPIEIFRAGSQTDNTGNTLNFTLADVQAMAACYDPAKHEAPLTLGHPSDNKPAYGWVKSLQATPDGHLLMLADQVDPVFAEDVKAGRFKKRSASFYPPNAPSNPAPGKWYLRHVAWLGALPPAVKGLADASFGMPSSDGAISFTL